MYFTCNNGMPNAECEWTIFCSRLKCWNVWNMVRWDLLASTEVCTTQIEIQICICNKYKLNPLVLLQYAYTTIHTLCLHVDVNALTPNWIDYATKNSECVCVCRLYWKNFLFTWLVVVYVMAFISLIYSWFCLYFAISYTWWTLCCLQIVCLISSHLISFHFVFVAIMYIEGDSWQSEMQTKKDNEAEKLIFVSLCHSFIQFWLRYAYIPVKDGLNCENKKTIQFDVVYLPVGFFSPPYELN